MSTPDEWPNLWEVSAPMPLLDALATPRVTITDDHLTFSYAPHPDAREWRARIERETLFVECRGTEPSTIYGACFGPQRYGWPEGSFRTVTLEERTQGVRVTVSRS